LVIIPFHLSESGLDAAAVKLPCLGHVSSNWPWLQLAPTYQGTPYLGCSALVVFWAMQKMNSTRTLG